MDAQTDVSVPKPIDQESPSIVFEKIPPRTVWAVLFSAAAAWLAAGSTGLMLPSTERVLVWICLGLVAACARPQGLRQWILLGGLVIVGLIWTQVIVMVPETLVLYIAAFLAVMASGQKGRKQSVLSVAAASIFAFALYRFSVTAIPFVWYLTDQTGMAASGFVSWLTGQPLETGASFGGLDLVFLPLVFVLCLSMYKPKHRWRWRLGTVAVVLGAWLAYLCLLAWGPELLKLLPVVAPEAEAEPPVPLAWRWHDAVRTLYPWHLPAVGALLQLLVLGLVLGKTAFNVEEVEAAPTPLTRKEKIIMAIAIVLAALVPIVAIQMPEPSYLTGKKIVAYAPSDAEGDGNAWDKPSHTQIYGSARDRFGLLPSLVESLGGKFEIIDSFDAESIEEYMQSIKDADLLLLVQPTREDEDRLSSPELGETNVLILTRPITPAPAAEEDGITEHAQNTDKEKDALEFLHARNDVAFGATRRWHRAMTPSYHAAAMGLSDCRNIMGINRGASFTPHMLSHPVLTGKWGWRDPGTDVLSTGGYEYNPGERLGDLMLAAEMQNLPFPKKYIVVGDVDGVTNGGISSSYPFVSRLLVYAASDHSWGIFEVYLRRNGAFLMILVLMTVVFSKIRCRKTAIVSIVLMMVLSLWITGGVARGIVRPSGVTLDANAKKAPQKGEAVDPQQTRHVALIDATHLEAFSSSEWANEGIESIVELLACNGYLPLVTTDFSSEKLNRAEVVLSIAPQRPFTGSDIKTVGDFVSHGGLYIMMAGAEDIKPNLPLIRHFGLDMPLSPVLPGVDAKEPTPMWKERRMVQMDMDESGKERQIPVEFFEGWPITYNEGKPGYTSLMRNVAGQSVVVAVRRGDGHFILIGDTAFALNKNLSGAPADPHNVRWENAQYWRWLLAKHTPLPDWWPPVLEEADPPADDGLAEETVPGTTSGSVLSGGEPDEGDTPGSRPPGEGALPPPEGNDADETREEGGR